MGAHLRVRAYNDWVLFFLLCCVPAPRHLDLAVGSMACPWRRAGRPPRTERSSGHADWPAGGRERPRDSRVGGVGARTAAPCPFVLYRLGARQSVSPRLPSAHPCGRPRRPSRTRGRGPRHAAWRHKPATCRTSHPFHQGRKRSAGRHHARALSLALSPPSPPSARLPTRRRDATAMSAPAQQRWRKKKYYHHRPPFKGAA